jgi:hypothetical protein
MKILRTAAIIVGAVAAVATLGATLAPALGIASAAGTLSTIAAVAGIASASVLGSLNPAPERLFVGRQAAPIRRLPASGEVYDGRRA